MATNRTIRLWRWHISIRRGGQATPWPWTEITISRRRPRKQADHG